MRFCARVLFSALLLSGGQALVASGYHPETVKGVGAGIDIISKGENPLPAVGVFWGEFGYLSYHARASFAHRLDDNTSFIRGGIGLGFILVLLNFDLTYQTGIQKSMGMYWGLSSFISGAWWTPEIFAGYQVNFAAGSDNFFLAGARFYLNFAEIGKH